MLSGEAGVVIGSAVVVEGEAAARKLVGGMEPDRRLGWEISDIWVEGTEVEVEVVEALLVVDGGSLEGDEGESHFLRFKSFISEFRPLGGREDML